MIDAGRLLNERLLRRHESTRSCLLQLGLDDFPIAELQ